MSAESLLPIDRFHHTLRIVHREGGHLAYSWHRVFSEEIDVAWVSSLSDHPERAERLEAFVSRFGRMQDTIADKLLPRWLRALAESPGSQIDVLNRAEQLGVLESTEDWLRARGLRNRLIHEYMEEPEPFAEDLLAARDATPMLLQTYNRIRQDAGQRLRTSETELPPRLDLPGLPSS